MRTIPRRDLSDSGIPPPARRARDRLHRGVLQRVSRAEDAGEIIQRLEGREFQILMAEAPLPDDAVDGRARLVQGVARAARARGRSQVGRPGRPAPRRRRVRRAEDSLQLARRDASGLARPGPLPRAHRRAGSVGHRGQGYDEVIVKTKNRYYDMRGTLDSLQFDVIKLDARAPIRSSPRSTEQAARAVRARCASQPAASDEGVGGRRARGDGPRLWKTCPTPSM